MKNKLVSWKKKKQRRVPDRGGLSADRLPREVDGLFDTCLGLARPRWHAAGSPGFEISETDGEIRVTADLPGMNEKDIEVSIDENMLTIRGERKEEKETRKRNYHVSETSYGNYSRTIPLPVEVDREKAEARFKRGVLTLILPKTEQAKARRKHIPVSVD